MRRWSGEFGSEGGSVCGLYAGVENVRTAYEVLRTRYAVLTMRVYFAGGAGSCRIAGLALRASLYWRRRSNVVWNSGRVESSLNSGDAFTWLKRW